MLSGKQRLELRAGANGLQAIIQIGKGGVEENLVKQVDDALEARELIKIKLLDTAPCEAREAAEALAENTGADVVQVVGRTVVLWRHSEKLARERAAQAARAAAQTAERPGKNARTDGKGGRRSGGGANAKKR